MTKTTSALIGLVFGLAIGAATVFFCLAVPARKENVTMREMLRSQADEIDKIAERYHKYASARNLDDCSKDMRRAADYSAPVFEKP